MDRKDKLPDDWYEPDQLILLYSSFPAQANKATLKKLLTKEGIKWTVKLKDEGVTKIVSTISTWRFTSSYSSLDTSLRTLYKTIGKDNIYHPVDVKRMIDNIYAGDMSEFSEQITDLLKSNDVVNLELAATLIGDSMIEDRWLPWIKINKDKDCIRELIIKKNLGLGQWNVSNTKWNFRTAVKDLQSRLEISNEHLKDFMYEFYMSVK